VWVVFGGHEPALSIGHLRKVVFDILCEFLHRAEVFATLTAFTGGGFDGGEGTLLIAIGAW
jgi:hypothetical protein